MAKLNSNTCGACGKWTVANANYCHHCAHPLKAQFENAASIIPFEDNPSPARHHWLNTDGGRWLTGATITIGGGAALAWLNQIDPGIGAAAAATLAAAGGAGLLLLKWRLERPGPPPPPKPTGLSITLHEPELSGGRAVAWHTYLDDLDPSITLDDLALAAQARNFSREAMARGGIPTQSPARAKRVSTPQLRLPPAQREARLRFDYAR